MKKIVLMISVTLFLFASITPICLADNPVELTVGLMNTVKSMELDPGIESALLAKLDAAMEALQSTDEAEYYSSIDNLRSFHKEVNEKKEHIPKDQVFQLRKMAKEIIKVIEGTSAETIGCEVGGTVSGTGELSGATVEIPPESLEADTLITVNENSSPPMLPTNFEEAGPAVDFGPEGTVFASPVTIKIPCNPGIAEEDLRLFTFVKAKDQWEEVMGSWVEGELICCQVEHFSSFQAGKKPSDPYAPYFQGIGLWNRKEPGGYYLFIVVQVIDPNEEFPDTLDEVSISGPDIPGGTYFFGPKDYWFDIPTGQAWYWARILLGDSPAVGGEYTFYARDWDGKEVTKTKVLSVNPIDMVDAATISPTDESIVSTNPTFNWSPVAYSGGAVWYRISIHNWRGQNIFRSNRSTKTSFTLDPDILRENSAYTFIVEAFDENNGERASNASMSQRLRIGTSDFNFNTSPVFDYGSAFTFHCDYASPTKLSLMLATKVRQGLNGPILGPGDIQGGQIEVHDPNGTDVYTLDATNYVIWSGEFYKTIPKEDFSDFSAGEYVFTVTVTDTDENKTNYGDYLNRVKILPIATQVSPINYEPVGPTPTFSWLPVPGAAMYWVAIDDASGTRVHSSPQITETEYTLGFPLPSGNYRWNVRAHDGINGPRIDNRSNTNYSWFIVIVE